MKNEKLLNMINYPRAQVVMGKKLTFPDVFHCTENGTGNAGVTLGLFSLCRPATDDDNKDPEKLIELTEACDVAITFMDRSAVRKFRDWLDWVDSAFAENERVAETTVPEPKE